MTGLKEFGDGLFLAPVTLTSIWIQKNANNDDEIVNYELIHHMSASAAARTSATARASAAARASEPLYHKPENLLNGTVRVEWSSTKKKSSQSNNAHF